MGAEHIFSAEVRTYKENGVLSPRKRIYEKCFVFKSITSDLKIFGLIKSSEADL